MLLFNPKLKLIVYLQGQAYTITDLYMDFEVECSLNKEPNRAKISIYNLSEKTRGLFSEQHQEVELHAGYAAGTSMIFLGTTSNVVHTKEGVNWRTDIYAGEGLKEYETRMFSKSYSKGTPIRQILTDMAQAYGLPYSVGETMFATNILGSVSYKGRIKDVLTKATEDYGMTWSVQRGVLEIIEEGSYIKSDPTAVVIRPSTGLLEAPSICVNTTKGGGKKKSLKVKCLLNPEIVPGRIIQLDTKKVVHDTDDLFRKKLKEETIVKNVDGIYIAKKLRYYGNNYGGDYVVEMYLDLQ